MPVVAVTIMNRVEQYDALEITGPAGVCEVSRGGRDEVAAVGMPGQHNLLWQRDRMSRGRGGASRQCGAVAAEQRRDSPLNRVIPQMS